MKPAFAFILISMFVCGCRNYFLPGPTQKNVTKADLVGVWEYPADYQSTKVTLELKADGTFVQSIKRSEHLEPQVHEGNWDLEGTTPILTILAPVFGDASQPWVLEKVNWWIVDSYQTGVTFAIFGAADPDPDSFSELDKIE